MLFTSVLKLFCPEVQEDVPPRPDACGFRKRILAESPAMQNYQKGTNTRCFSNTAMDMGVLFCGANLSNWFIFTN